ILQIMLNWSAGSNDVSYKVYRSTVSGFTISLSTLIGNTSSTTYTNAGVTAGTVYYYLTGLNAAGQESAPSSQVSATAQAPPPPGSPAGLAASVSTGQIVLNWTAGSNDASYNVYRSTISGFAISSGTLVGGSGTTSYTDTSAAAGTTYYYLVTGLNASGQESAPSNQVSAKITAVSGLVAAYNFDEGTGTLVHDLSGNGNNGTIQNAKWSKGGKYGGALSFNGSNSWVTIANSASLHLTTGVTLEAWIDPASISGWRVIMDKERIAASGLSYALYATDPDQPPSAPSGFINTGG